MCMWQSHVSAGALRVGASVPAELGTGSAWLGRMTMAPVALTIASPAPCNSLRRAIMDCSPAMMSAAPEPEVALQLPRGHLRTPESGHQFIVLLPTPRVHAQAEPD